MTSACLRGALEHRSNLWSFPGRYLMSARPYGQSSRTECARGINVCLLGMLNSQTKEELATKEERLRMRSVIMIVYVIIGVAVAAARGYLGDVGNIGDIVNLLLAVLLWPLVLLGVEFNLNIGGGKGGNKKGALLLAPLTFARSWLGVRATTRTAST
jgi:hypothetical protein